MRVAIIEDSRELALTIKEFLESHHIEVVAMCHNGKEAIDLLDTKQFDLLLLDLILPHTDGLSLLKHNIPKSRPYKIICFSAFGHEHVMQESLKYGADYFLLKPLNFNTILEQIEMICGVDIKDSKEFNLEKYCFKSNLKGTKYLIQALNIINEQPDKIQHLTTQLYPEIADFHEIKTANVERSIRHAIENAWTNGLDKVFNQKGKYIKPSIGELLVYLNGEL